MKGSRCSGCPYAATHIRMHRQNAKTFRTKRTYGSQRACDNNPLDASSLLGCSQSSQCPFSRWHNQVIGTLRRRRRERACDMQNISTILTCFKPSIIFCQVRNSELDALDLVLGRATNLEHFLDFISAFQISQCCAYAIALTQEINNAVRCYKARAASY